ncbi:MAG: hypothetical protein A2514_02925 [Gammaproteobacteria bacterium RIFOXYD12_FULL_61_37]|nr:MAG: hypothetical protein A2514_02925 [Gammaproteobacteria bacterium RIFOXYD12_FULL_61_37]
MILRLAQPHCADHLRSSPASSASRGAIRSSGSDSAARPVAASAAAGTGDGSQTARAVAAGARQHHADHGRAPLLGGRLEQGVDGGTDTVRRLARHQGEVLALDQQMVIGRRQRDGAGPDRRLVLRLAHRQDADLAQQQRQRIAAAGIAVLCHGQRRRPARHGRRQRAEQGAQGLETAERCADDDQPGVHRALR